MSVLSNSIKCMQENFDYNSTRMYDIKVNIVFHVAQSVKHLPAKQQIWVHFLG